MRKLQPKRRILIVGEGRETEYNYFVGFRNTYQDDLEATATSVRVVRGKGGSARNIVSNAIKEARKFQPDRKRGDRVFLLLDTEGIGRAPELPEAERLAKQSGVEIVYSCPAFEYWLLCHFSSVSRGHFKDCASVITALDKKWSTVCAAKYGKTDQDIFDRLAHLVKPACAQALRIDLHHLQTTNAASKSNPSTQVYELIAILIGTRTGSKCPITGTWNLVGDASITTELNKGDTMPSQDNNAAHWKL